MMRYVMLCYDMLCYNGWEGRGGRRCVMIGCVSGCVL